ncbi:hypothetical protein [Streptomyces cavourensis]|uniref:hypothetical protein n=1 Tax=Streptomyces cavourensis TaxID=67258 RepID=UPI0013C300B1|nr:hypothetical protein [Streptomyces cavourensis]
MLITSSHCSGESSGSVTATPFSFSRAYSAARSRPWSAGSSPPDAGRGAPPDSKASSKSGAGRAAEWFMAVLSLSGGAALRGGAPRDGRSEQA